MMKHLDRNLYIGGEVKEVYDELVKTLDEDHLRFDLVNLLHLRYATFFFGRTFLIAETLIYRTTMCSKRR